MTDPDDFAAEIIKNLLHLDIDKRREGFLQLKSNWDIKFREFLWKAIEEEKNKKFQSELVNFSVNTLKKNSLRKMIRFLEKDQLHPKSRNIVAMNYFEYETEDVRDALLKSLRRRGSTFKFVASLHQIPIENHLASTTINFVTDVLNPEISNEYRKEILVSIMNRYFSNSSFNHVLKDQIWTFILSDTYLNHILLEMFFTKSQEIPLLISKPKYFPDLIWKNWDWNIGRDGKSKELREGLLYSNVYLDQLEQPDLFILNSNKIQNPLVETSLIKTLRTLHIKIPPPGTTEVYLRNFYEVWNFIEKNQLSISLLEMERLDKIDLDNLIPKKIFYDKLSNQSFSEYLSTLNINPIDIIARILAYLPRTYLFNYCFSDDQDVGILAIQSLLEEDFHKVNSVERLIGSPHMWFGFFEKSIKQFNQERSPDYYNELTELIFLLSNLLIQDKKKLFSSYIIENLSSSMKEIELLEDKDYGIPIKLKLSQLLGFEEVRISPTFTITSKQQVILFKDLFSKIDHDIYFQSLQNIILMDDYDAQQLILEFLNQEIFVNPEVDMRQVGQLIFKLCESLTKSSDVRIRTKSTLLKNQLNEFSY